MTAPDLLTLVARLRFFQKQYLRTRAAFSLQEVRKLEQKIDALLDSQEPPSETLTINLKIKKHENANLIKLRPHIDKSASDGAIP